MILQWKQYNMITKIIKLLTKNIEIEKIPGHTVENVKLPKKDFDAAIKKFKDIDKILEKISIIVEDL